jgi:hypothetical protein
MLLLTLLLSNNKVHGFGTRSVSVNKILLTSRMVTQGYTLLTRTRSERNDKAFLPWNMARTLTTKHAHADADADVAGSPASGNYELMEMMRSMLESQKDTETKVYNMLQSQKDMQTNMNKMLESQKDMATKVNKILESQRAMATKKQVQGMEKRLEKQLSTLEDKIDILIEIQARAKARRMVADDFR